MPSSPLNSDYQQLTFNPSIVVMAMVIAVTGIAVWANPKRKVNMAFAFLSLHVMAWLTLLHLSVEQVFTGMHGLWIVRATAAVGAFFPFSLWVVQDAVVSPQAGTLNLLRRGLPWLLAGCLCAAMTISPQYIPDTSTREQPQYGFLRQTYIAAMLLLYGAVAYRGLRRRKALEGVKRVELDILLIGGTATAMIATALMAAATLWQASLLNRFQPIVVSALYCTIVISMITRRVLNARQLMTVLFQRLALAAGLVALAGLFFLVLHSTELPLAVTVTATTAATLFVGSFLNGALNQFFQVYPQAHGARRAVLEASRTHSTASSLETEFKSIIKGWGQSETALLQFGRTGTADVGDSELLPGRPDLLKALRHVGWATPERISRERPSPELPAILGFLQEHNLGVVVFVEGPQYAVLVGAGLPASRVPYTYPKITQLLELATLMESALDRARYSAKAQRTQQLAAIGLIGASLADELRAPIGRIRNFLDLIPQKRDDERFCELFVTPVSAEVERIEKITTQFLDLSQPRTYSASELDVSPLIEACIDMVRSGGAQKITLRYLRPNQAVNVYSDPVALTQVILSLLVNAIQAFEGNDSGNEVTMSVRTSGAFVTIIVDDNGPGVAPAIRPRLFEPFQTTRKGHLGLGLAISQDILANLQGRLSCVEKEGRGARFEIELPAEDALAKIA